MQTSFRFRLRQVFAVATAVAIVGGAATVAAQPANAAQVTAPNLHGTAVVSRGASSTTVITHSTVTVAHIVTRAANGAIATPANTITCELKVNNPHESHHEPGTVNVVATIGCDGAVDSLSMQSGLYFNGTLMTEGGNNNTAKGTLQANAATPCVNGVYTGGATGYVVFPAGYVPPTGDFGGEVWSPDMTITCKESQRNGNQPSSLIVDHSDR